MLAEVFIVLLLSAALAGLLTLATWIWGGPLLQAVAMQ